METKQQDSTQVRKSKISDIFTLVKDKNDKIFIAVGQYKVCNKSFDTFEQAERYIGTKPYEIIVNLIGLAIYEKENAKATKPTKKTAKSMAENKENA